MHIDVVPDNAGVVIAVVIVVVVLILVGCITMDILFCYCCKRKERHQDNGMYICTYVHTFMSITAVLCSTYVCTYIYNT